MKEMNGEVLEEEGLVVKEFSVSRKGTRELYLVFTGNKAGGASPGESL